VYYGFDKGGPDTSLVTNGWVHQTVQLGPLGSMYPNVSFTMEGDSPAIFFIMQNGLNAPEQPEWEAAGAAATSPSNNGEQHFSAVADRATGENGEE